MRYLAQGWDRLVRYPLLLAVPLVVRLVLSAFGLGASNLAMEWMEAGTAGDGGGFLLLGILTIALAGPATASGYNAMVARAAAGEQAGFGVFLANLGRYYGRIIGGALLLAFVMGVTGAAFGLENYLAVSIVSIPLAALQHIWLAAVVTDDAGVLAATGRMWREATSRIGDYGPLFVIAILASVGIPELLGMRSAGVAQTPTFARNLSSVLSGLLVTAASMWVRAGVFVAYREGRRDGQA